MSGTEEQLSFDFSEATQELSEVSLGELTHLCEVYASLKKEISEIEETVDTKKASMRDAGAKIMNILNAAKMPSIKNDFGNFIISNRFTVTTPKSPEEKEPPARPPGGPPSAVLVRVGQQRQETSAA